MAFTNSDLVTYKKISPHKVNSRNHIIDTITIHCYVGQVTAKQGCNYFASTTKKASANYVVGKDGSIGLSVEEKDRSYCSSNAENDNRAVTIEVASDTTPPYRVTDKALASLVELIADICKRNSIKELKWKADKSLIGNVNKQNMTVHRWFANKSCPGDYLYGKHTYIVEQVNKKLGVSSVPASSTLKFKVGDVVKFVGGKHYGSAVAAKGSAVAASRARITAISENGKHPYHIRAINEKGAFISGVYGWVDVSTVSAVTTNFVPYQVKVTTNTLNIRKGAGTNYGKIETIKDGGIYTIIDEATGKGATKWGLLKSYEKGRNGWVSLDYVKRIK